jgi:hypothetical protein
LKTIIYPPMTIATSSFLAVLRNRRTPTFRRLSIVSMMKSFLSLRGVKRNDGGGSDDISAILSLELVLDFIGWQRHHRQRPYLFLNA